jgi:hypothetical protein
VTLAVIAFATLAGAVVFGGSREPGTTPRCWSTAWSSAGCLPFFAAMRWSADEAAFLQHLPKKTPIGAKMRRDAVTSSKLVIVLAPAFRF